jgi:hypothetical protein
VSSNVCIENYLRCLFCYWDHFKTIFMLYTFLYGGHNLCFAFLKCLVWDGECVVVDINAIANFSSFRFFFHFFFLQ